MNKINYCLLLILWFTLAGCHRATTAPHLPSVALSSTNPAQEDSLEKSLAHLDSISKTLQVDSSVDTQSSSLAKQVITGDEHDLQINFQHYSLIETFQSLAKIKHINIVLSKSIQSDISINLSHVSWQRAVEIILQSQGLSTIAFGNILYIAPINEIAEQEKQGALLQASAPLITRLIALKYAKADDILQLLTKKDEPLLSTRGHASIDQRTNSILIQDTQNQLINIDRFIHQLDQPNKQVMIEARIVNVDNDYEKDLGIEYGLSANPNFDKNRNSSNQFNVDLPAISMSAANSGLAVFTLSKTTLLDLELSALESEGKATIISNPKLLTANQQTAMIQAGEEIPYQESAGENSTKTAFKKAVLSLSVTPQITPDNNLILKLQVNQDKRSSAQVQGVPTIDTRQISTQVNIHNGETVVLGGIYEQTKIKGINRVPFFSEIPLVGVLFQHRKDVETRRELLIFVTPKIVSP